MQTVHRFLCVLQVKAEQFSLKRHSPGPFPPFLAVVVPLSLALPL